jgi:hypothetical protein
VNWARCIRVVVVSEIYARVLQEDGPRLALESGNQCCADA